MSDRLAVMNDGRIEQLGTPIDVYERPANEFVAGFIGVSNLLERDGRRFTIRPEKIVDGSADRTRPCRGLPRRAGSDRRRRSTSARHALFVELEAGETLIAVSQNLETADGEALLEARESARRMSSWLEAQTFTINTTVRVSGEARSERRGHINEVPTSAAVTALAAAASAERARWRCAPAAAPLRA